MVKILFFIGSLVSGGKERRFVELLTYLKQTNDFEILVITTGKEVHFPVFYDLGIKLVFINKKNAFFGLNIPVEIYQIAKKFSPDIIHTWGRMQTFYSIPTILLSNYKLINGQITNATPNKDYFKKIIDFLNFKSSDLIISNSQAGIDIYNPPKSKAVVIPNGLNLSRFQQLTSIKEIKLKYGIKTKFAVVMVATFSKNKDYTFFFEVAQFLTEKREDVTFVAVGTYHKNENQFFESFKDSIQNLPRIITTGVIYDVEALVNACDIGVLFSNSKLHGEGLSNAILEYMALGKPVIANNSGGTKELVKHQVNGYLFQKESPEKIGLLISEWLDDQSKRNKLGQSGKTLIEDSFSLNIMGKSYQRLYSQIISSKNEK